MVSLDANRGWPKKILCGHRGRDCCGGPLATKAAHRFDTLVARKITRILDPTANRLPHQLGVVADPVTSTWHSASENEDLEGIEGPGILAKIPQDSAPLCPSSA